MYDVHFKITHTKHGMALRNSPFIINLLYQGVGLCHGISGSAFVFLACHRSAAASRVEGRAEASERQLRRAQRFALYAAQHWSDLYRIPDRPASLYEGLSGALVLWSQVLGSLRAAHACGAAVHDGIGALGFEL